MSGGTFTIPNSIFLISQSSSNLFLLDTSRSTLSGLDVLIIGVFFIDFVKFWPDLVRSPRDSFDSRPIPESWLELELFLEDSSLFGFTSLLSLLDLMTVPGLRTFMFLGDPLGEFFSPEVRDSSRLFVCGVLPAPVEPALEAEAGECEGPPPPLTFTDKLLLFMLFRRLLEDLPCEDVRTGENSVFPPRRPSPTSWSVECSLDFIVRGGASAPSGHISGGTLSQSAGVEIKTHPALLCKTWLGGRGVEQLLILCSGYTCGQCGQELFIYCDLSPSFSQSQSGSSSIRVRVSGHRSPRSSLDWGLSRVKWAAAWDGAKQSAGPILGHGETIGPVS